MANSKGRRCKGDLHTGARCKRKKDGSGEAATLNSACSRCREWRCRAHCRCGRQGSATGRHAPRPGLQPRAKAKARPAPAPASAPASANEVAVPRPVGRPAALSTEVFMDNSWRARLLADLDTASSVLLASYLYDDPELQAVFLRRLRGRAPFSLDLLVDSSMFEARTCCHQRPRLLELHRPL